MRNRIEYDRTSYDDDAIRSISLDMDTSLNGRSLDVDTMTAVVDIRAAETIGGFLTAEGYPFLTADEEPLLVGVATPAPHMLSQTTPIRFLRGGSQHSIWYRSGVRRIGPSLYALSLTSSLGRLAQLPHKGGIYAGELAGDVIDEICGAVPHYVDPVFESVPLYGWLPYLSPSGEDGADSGSAKDNLMQVLFALNATVRADADGTLRIENLSTGVAANLTDDQIFRDGASVEYANPITTLTVLEHQYVEGSDPVILFEGTAENGQVVVFDRPVSDLGASGFSVLECGANYAVLSAGVGTLAGVPYIHITREVTRTITVGSFVNEARIEGATLVGITNSADVADRLAEYYAHRSWIQVNADVGMLAAGVVVSIYDPYDRIMRSATVESIYQTTVSTIMRGAVSALVDFLPWQVTPFVDRVVVLTGSGTWTPPDGVEYVTAILIGAGSGGTAGTDGEDALTLTVSVSGGTRAVKVPDFPPASLGGDAGDPGASGKIFRASLAVSGPVAYACGVGGAGESRANESPAQAGTATIFGDLTSEDGAASVDGYVDPVSGTAYAKAGASGHRGGNGGGTIRTSSSEVGWEPVLPESVTDGGTTWSGGDQGQTQEGSDLLYVSGGFGGGAAYGSDGGAGADADLTVVGNRILASPGGQGADAADPPVRGYGFGGGGGNGGGGAGQTGVPLRISAETTIGFTQQPTRGGYGSDGGDGGDGCIILYYREPVS